eukprot:1730708-Prymnesium_polylepis.1
MITVGSGRPSGTALPSGTVGYRRVPSRTGGAPNKVLTHAPRPTHRPDLAVEGGGRGGDLLLLDTKVASPYVNSLTAEERHRS